MTVKTRFHGHDGGGSINTSETFFRINSFSFWAHSFCEILQSAFRDACFEYIQTHFPPKDSFHFQVSVFRKTTDVCFPWGEITDLKTPLKSPGTEFKQLVSKNRMGSVYLFYSFNQQTKNRIKNIWSALNTSLSKEWVAIMTRKMIWETLWFKNSLKLRRLGKTNHEIFMLHIEMLMVGVIAFLLRCSKETRDCYLYVELSSKLFIPLVDLRLK